MEQLLAIQGPPAPPDYAGFWQRTREEWERDECGRVVGRGDSGQRLEGYKIEYVRFTSMNDWELGGWLATPIEQPVTRGLIIGHGYAGRRGPEVDYRIPGAALLFPCVRGIALSRREGVSQVPQRHVIIGLESPETSIIRDCVADLWSAFSALVECVPETAARLDYAGASLAGGLGMMALAWDPRIEAAHLEISTFGHHRLRLRLPCTGSGVGLANYAHNHPEAYETLAYLDPAVAAQFVKRPILHACARFDPAVPPPSQFAIFNAHAGPKKLFRLTAGHWDYPDYTEEREDLNRAIEKFFNASARARAPEAS